VRSNVTIDVRNIANAEDETATLDRTPEDYAGVAAKKNSLGGRAKRKRDQDAEGWPIPSRSRGARCEWRGEPFNASGPSYHREFEVDIKRARRITAGKLLRNRLLWFREKLLEASESLVARERKKCLRRTRIAIKQALWHTSSYSAIRFSTI
jgi:hypothetical protein